MRQDILKLLILIGNLGKKQICVLINDISFREEIDSWNFPHVCCYLLDFWFDPVFTIETP